MGLKTTIEEGEKAKEAWLTAFPEMRQFIQGIPDPKHPGQFMGETLSGRIRSCSTQPETCNHNFQGTTSDGASDMLWETFVHGVRVVAFVHDEIIYEVPITNKIGMTKEVQRTEKIMLDCMNSHITDVKVGVGSSLMTRWFKEAEGELDEEGNHKIAIDVQSDPDTGKPRAIYVDVDDYLKQNKLN